MFKCELCGVFLDLEAVKHHNCKRKQAILNVVSDLVGSFLYYDRKESESLPTGSIEEAVVAGEITWDEIVEAFRKELPGS